jgi:hypothetical protein
MLARIRLAQAFCEVLRAQIPEATVSIRGTYASVALADRSCRVFCDFHRRIVVLESRGRTVVECEMHDDAPIIGCIRAWVVERWMLDTLAARFPHFDGGKEQNLRLAKLLGSRLPQTPAVRIELELTDGLASTVWICGNQRSCAVGGRDECGCELWTPERRIARLLVAEEALPGVVSGWAQTQASLDDLRPACIRVEDGDPDAPVDRVPPPPERASARAHAAWIKAAAQIRDRPMLGPLRPLLQPILDRPTILQFFPFFSLYRLCLSSSSGYCWVTDGLPIIEPVGGPGAFLCAEEGERAWHRDNARYILEIGRDSTEAGVEETVARIEAAAAAAPYRPFVGNESDLSSAQLDAELIRQGRLHRVARTRSGEVVLWHRRRSIAISGRSRWWATFGEKHDRLQASFDDIAELVRTACRWLDDSPSLDDLHGWIPGSSLEKRVRQTVVIRG